MKNEDPDQLVGRRVSREATWPETLGIRARALPPGTRAYAAVSFDIKFVPFVEDHHSSVRLRVVSRVEPSKKVHIAAVPTGKTPAPSMVLCQVSEDPAPDPPRLGLESAELLSLQA